ncbi:hypothetical protein [Streptomyces sp. NPDC005374]|uniref:AraC-like ligand-binding domain-containing protein n=1 Tax=Streptomyces sp. NPDC005374 TaxID=3364713 RepID=UPI00368BE635
MTVVTDPSFDLDLDPDVASSADEAVRAWQMAENAFAAVALRPTGRHGLRAAVRTRALGDLVIADWSTPDFEGVRTREMADADSVILVTVSEGRQIIETSHDALVLRPGSLALVNTGRPGRVVVPGTLVKRAIRIPMTALAPFDTGHGSPQSVVFEARDNALSTLLHDHAAASTSTWAACHGSRWKRRVTPCWCW